MKGYVIQVMDTKSRCYWYVWQWEVGTDNLVDIKLCDKIDEAEIFSGNPYAPASAIPDIMKRVEEKFGKFGFEDVKIVKVERTTVILEDNDVR